MIDNINVLVLAYLGDTIYENYVREYLIKSGLNNVNELQNASINYVSAKAQCKFLKELMDDNFFNDEEISVIKRGRNHKSNRHPKSCDIITYKNATSFEAIIGYLKLKNDINRIEEIVNKILY